MRRLLALLGFVAFMSISSSAFAADGVSEREALRHGAEQVTKRGEQVMLLDQTFEQNARGGTLYVIDKDHINFLAATDTTRSYDDARKAVLKAEMRRQTGRVTTDEQFDKFLDHIDRGAAAAWGFNAELHERFQFCVMLPGEPDKYVAQKKKGLAGRVASKAILGAELSHAQSVRRTDLHETVHCMDRWFVPLLDEDNPDRLGDEHVRYKAEMLADVGAILLMAARDGDATVAQRTADLRALGVRASQFQTGRHLRFSHGPGDPMRSMAYDTAPGLRYAQRVIEHMGMDKLKAMSTTELVDLAKYIVDRKAMDRDTFEIMVRYTDQGLEGIKKLQQERGQEPGWNKKLEKAQARLRQLVAIERRIVDRTQLKTRSHQTPTITDERMKSWVDWVHERAEHHGGGPQAIHTALGEAANFVRRELAKNSPNFEDEMELLRRLPQEVHKGLKAKADAEAAARAAKLRHVEIRELPPLIIRGAGPGNN